MTETQNPAADGTASGAPKTVPDQNALGISRPRRRAQAATAKPKPISVAYTRSDDLADMVEIGPHQAASLDALLARRLMPSSIKAVEAA